MTNFTGPTSQHSCAADAKCQLASLLHWQANSYTTNHLKVTFQAQVVWVDECGSLGLGLFAIPPEVQHVYSALHASYMNVITMW